MEDKAKISSLHDFITINGACEHNLKNVSVEIPKNKFVVITGPSGSGKSSLAMDTLYQEGRRRYVQSLSTYVRQFLGVGSRPKVDQILGICPAVAIDQKTVGFNPRSTVGTITEIYDYLRLLFARAGTPFCPKCKTKMSNTSKDEIVELVVKEFSEKMICALAPLANSRKGEFEKELQKYFMQGYESFVIDGKETKFANVSSILTLKLNKKQVHNIFVVLDKFVVSQSERYRVAEVVEKSLLISECLFAVGVADCPIQYFSTKQSCFNCSVSMIEIEPRMFSFNSPVGACKDCGGLGVKSFLGLSQEKMIDLFESKNAFARVCDSCNGDRLNEVVLSVKIQDKNIADFCKMSIGDALVFISQLKLSDRQASIVKKVVGEIESRLKFLCDVGLEYLTLSRNAPTLSGGEGQRIRLATQIGSALSGVLYVLDEPSIGLHQRDNLKLIQTLKALRDIGNSVVVVEHDTEMMSECDYIIDMGPGAGALGGEIMAIGTPQEICKNDNSLSGKYLSGVFNIEVPEIRRAPKGWLKIKGLHKNNLKNLDIDIPLGVLTVFTGVSGSGKSSIVSQSLAPFFERYFSMKITRSHDFDSISGIDEIKNVVVVDQTPIGKTPRSNPATYIGIFGFIRSLFSELPEAMAKGMGPGHFSFNVDAGRCSECNGEGTIKISMLFMEDEIVTCQVCQGERYSKSVLDLRYNGKNISDVLNMTFAQAAEFFQDFPALKKRLDLLCEVGLDYMILGQSSTTLSGGEAQRIKLVCELAKRGAETLYILDEPTVGLHNHDIKKLMGVLYRLVERGNSVIVIEHNLDLIKCADYVLDIGPEGGSGGGQVVAAGTPEEVAKCKDGYTGKFLSKILNS